MATTKIREAEREFRTQKRLVGVGVWHDYEYPVETYSAPRLNGYWARKYPPIKREAQGLAPEYNLFVDNKLQLIPFSVNSTGSRANPHVLIAGKSQESGKTTLTNIILREEMVRGAFPIVFDPKGEYYQLPMYGMEKKIKKVAFDSWDSPLKLKPSMLTLDDWRLIIDKYLSGEGTKQAFHLVRRCALDLKRRNQPLDFESLQDRIKAEKGRGFTGGKWENMLDTIDVFFEDLNSTNLFDEQTGIDIEQLIKGDYRSLVLDIAAPEDMLHVSLAAHNILEQVFRIKTKNDPKRNRKFDRMLWEKRIWICLEKGSRVSMADGNLKKIEDVCVGDTVLSFSDEMHQESQQVTAVMDNGLQQTFKITTRDGFSINATAEHKFITPTGKKTVRELAVGDSIPLPSPQSMPLSSSSLSVDEAKVLGYMISEGSITEQCTSFSNTNRNLCEDFLNSVLAMNGNPEKHPQITTQGNLYSVHIRQKMQNTGLQENKAFTLLRESCLVGCLSEEKFIPDKIFSSRPASISAFLSSLYSGDGYICTDKANKGMRQVIGYSSNSHRLVKDLQMLLARIGIRSKIEVSHKARMKYNHHRELRKSTGYRVVIVQYAERKKFFDFVGSFGKEATIYTPDRHSMFDGVQKEIWKIIKDEKGEMSLYELSKRIGMKPKALMKMKGDKRKRNLSRSVLKKIATELNSKKLAAICSHDIYWDNIVSIEPIGMRHVYDINISNTHRFIAEGILLLNCIDEAADPVDGLINQQSKMACRAKFEKIFSKYAYSNIMGMVVTQHLQFISTRVINNCSNIFIGKMVEPNAIQKIANMGVLSSTDLQFMFSQFKVGSFLDITKTKSLREPKIYGVFLPSDWKATGQQSG